MEKKRYFTSKELIENRNRSIALGLKIEHIKRTQKTKQIQEVIYAAGIVAIIAINIVTFLI
ncbi:MAG: hypothetical protein RSA49_04160 [Anaerovoracaceae bacterium]|uniref:hypothetical protein n=1 Tax=Chryseobacterium sp. TaxID=1871047 RepID=UPI002FC942E4